jgi:uncharacterized membrane protein
MGASAFSSGEAIGVGWRTFKANIWLMIGAFLLFMVMDGGLGVLVELSDSASRLTLAALYLVGYVLGVFGKLGYTHLALRVVDGEEAAIEDLFSQGRLLVRAVLATIVYVGIVIGGFLLLIVPGIIWCIKFQYYIYAIVDEDAGVMESLKRSSALTRGEKLNLFWYGLLCGLVGLLGALALCVGVLAAAPTVALASAYVYRRLVASDAERREFVWPE